jgi:hypothetical protein
LVSAAAEALLPEVPKLERSQVTASFIVENAKAVAGIGMAVLGAGVIVMILLSLLGNVGLNQDQHSSDNAYAPATVEVHAHRKVRTSLCMPGSEGQLCLCDRPPVCRIGVSTGQRYCGGLLHCTPALLATRIHGPTTVRCNTGSELPQHGVLHVCERHTLVTY